MATQPLKLPVSSVIGKDGAVANARLINAYPEIVERDGKSSYAIYGAPGLTRWDDGTLTGSERGMIALSDSALVAILGSQVATFDNAGTFGSVIGGIAGTGRCVVAKNRAAPTNQVAIVTKDGQYYLVTSGTTVTKQALADLPAPKSVDYLAGRFIFGIEDGRLFCSGIDDGTTVGAASFDTANARPGNLVRAKAYGNYLAVFKEYSIEIWAPDPALANAPFPYSNTNTVITLGCMAAHSIAELDNGLVWVDNNGVVRNGVSQAAARISTHSVERAIASLSAEDKADLVGSVCSWEGHKVYTLTSSEWTWQYDVAGPEGAGNWYERKSYGSARWNVNSCVEFAGKYLWGDASTGELYYLDPSNYTDDGAAIVLEVWCGVSHRFPGQLIADKISIDIVAGVGLSSGLDSNDSPHLMIDYSDDGGKTFQGERFEPMGAVGEYGRTIESFMWGLVTECGRIWRFRASAAVLKAIISASLTGRPVRG